MIAIVDRNTTSGVGERGMEDVPIAEQAEARAFLAHHAIELGLDRRTPQQVCAELVLLTETQKDQAMLEYEINRSENPGSHEFDPVLGERDCGGLPADQAGNMTLSASTQRRKL